MNRSLSEPSQTLPFAAPPEVRALAKACPSFQLVGSIQELLELATPTESSGWHEVVYDIPGRGKIGEAKVCRARNGIVANYLEPYMRRRDPDSVVIGDALPTDKPRFEERFGKPFSPVREETLAWLGRQAVIAFAFHASQQDHGTQTLAVLPRNAAFFAATRAENSPLVGTAPMEPTIRQKPQNNWSNGTICISF